MEDGSVGACVGVVCWCGAVVVVGPSGHWGWMYWQLGARAQVLPRSCPGPAMSQASWLVLLGRTVCLKRSARATCLQTLETRAAGMSAAVSVK